MSNKELEVIVDSLTYGELKQIAAMFNNQGQGQATVQTPSFHPFKLGAVYLIRTVTMTQTGRLVDVTPAELVLEDAAWIADTGRFSEALRTLNFKEVEPFPSGRVIVGRGALIDAVEISATVTTLKP